jgi:hypothetical protein
MATVSIKDSGIPRLYRTVWLRSDVGPDSGTLARTLFGALAGLGQDTDTTPLFSAYQDEVNKALAQNRAHEITDADVVAIEERAWNTYATAVEDEATRIEDDAYSLYLETEAAAFEKYGVPGTKNIRPEANADYTREVDAAYAIYEEAAATAQMMRDEASEHVKDRVIVAAGKPPTPIWPALVAVGIITGGIWALWKGHA